MSVAKRIVRMPVVWLVLLGLLLAACGSSGTINSSAVEESVGTVQPEPLSDDSDVAPAGVEPESVEPPAATEAPIAEPAAAPSAEEISALPEELRGVLESTTGDQVDLASFRGEDVVLWFWAPW